MAMMRALLILGGMEADVALQFTLHSWRHLLPTAARQLRLSDSDQVEIGHWTTGSAMPRRYDSAACVTELTAKAAILQAMGRGWALAEPGCVAAPPPPPPPPIADGSPVLPTSAPLSKTTGGKALGDKQKLQLVKRAPHVIPSRVGAKDINVLSLGRHVSHINTGKTHLWKAGEKTLCRRWQCGSPDAATYLAKFMDEGVFIADCTLTPQCRVCFAKKLDFLMVPPDTDMGLSPADDTNAVSSGHSSRDSTETVASFSSAPASPSVSSDDAPLLKTRRT